MTEIKVYKCGYCGTVFNCKESAQQCEKSHVKPYDVQEYHYKQGERYPGFIFLTMLDGKQIKYTRSYGKDSEK